MPQKDAQIPLRCPKCGSSLRYGTSSAGGAGSNRPGDIFAIGADVHHYACTNGPCGNFWKFGPDTQLMEDPLQLAAAAGKTAASSRP